MIWKSSKNALKIFEYLYKNDQWMILQRRFGDSKRYRKYFRLRAKNHFSIFRSYFKGHLWSKIVRISWKFGQRCKISKIIIIYKIKLFNFVSAYAKRNSLLPGQTYYSISLHYSYQLYKHIKNFFSDRIPKTVSALSTKIN